MIDRRLSFLHENPVRAGIVDFASHHKYSSAVDYYEERPGLPKVELLHQRDSLGVGSKPDGVLVFIEKIYSSGGRLKPERVIEGLRRLFVWYLRVDWAIIHHSLLRYPI